MTRLWPVVLLALVSCRPKPVADPCIVDECAPDLYECVDVERDADCWSLYDSCLYQCRQKEPQR